MGKTIGWSNSKVNNIKPLYVGGLKGELEYLWERDYLRALIKNNMKKYFLCKIYIMDSKYCFVRDGDKFFEVIILIRRENVWNWKSKS